MGTEALDTPRRIAARCRDGGGKGGGGVGIRRVVSGCAGFLGLGRWKVVVVGGIEKKSGKCLCVREGFLLGVCGLGNYSTMQCTVPYSEEAHGRDVMVRRQRRG